MKSAVADLPSKRIPSEPPIIVLLLTVKFSQWLPSVEEEVAEPVAATATISDVPVPILKVLFSIVRWLDSLIILKPQPSTVLL